MITVINMMAPSRFHRNSNNNNLKSKNNHSQQQGNLLIYQLNIHISSNSLRITNSHQIHLQNLPSHHFAINRFQQTHLAVRFKLIIIKTAPMAGRTTIAQWYQNILRLKLHIHLHSSCIQINEKRMKQKKCLNNIA